MKINKDRIKSVALFAYVVLTVMGIYSAAIFYAGTQFAHASTDVVSAHKASK